jgi:hypothetical protein
MKVWVTDLIGRQEPATCTKMTEHYALVYHDMVTPPSVRIYKRENEDVPHTWNHPDTGVVTITERG